MGYKAQVPGLARRRRRGRAQGLHRRGQRGRGRPRRHPPPAGHPGTRPGRPLELQGRQVRLVLGGDQRPPAPDVHDAHVHVRGGRDGHRHADAHLPGDPRPGHRRVVQLPEGARDPVLRRRPTSSRASSACSRSTSSARRSSASASSASCATTPATSSATTRRTRSTSPVRVSSCGWPSWTCTRSDVADRQQIAAGGVRARLLQHHQVLHRGLPRAHQDHRQRAHPDEGARGGPPLRPAGLAGLQDRHREARQGDP